MPRFEGPSKMRFRVSISESFRKKDKNLASKALQKYSLMVLYYPLKYVLENSGFFVWRSRRVYNSHLQNFHQKFRFIQDDRLKLQNMFLNKSTQKEVKNVPPKFTIIFHKMMKILSLKVFAKKRSKTLFKPFSCLKNSRFLIKRCFKDVPHYYLNNSLNTFNFSFKCVLKPLVRIGSNVNMASPNIFNRFWLNSAPNGLYHSKWSGF